LQLTHREPRNWYPNLPKCRRKKTPPKRGWVKLL
jgi:hypothetical protein